MQYLDAMGIDSFVPRFLLPGANAPIPCSLSAVPEGTSDQQDKPDIAPVVEGFASVPLVQSGPTSEDDTESASASVENQASASFSLALWRVGERLQVIDSRQSGDALPTQSLLGNILSVIGMSIPPLSNVEILHWPMHAKAQDKSWCAATQMVQGFLEARFADKPVSHLWLFGEDACRAVLGAQAAVGLFQRQRLETLAVDAIVLPSLGALLYRPELKIDVWRALKGFESESDGMERSGG